MTIQGIRSNRSIRYLSLPSLWEISIILLLFYAFYFQYGVMTINNAMLVLNSICILFGIWHLILGVYKGIHSFYSWIITFVCVSVLFGILFGVSSAASFDAGLHMIEYCLTGFSILLFSLSHKERYLNILFYTWLSILLLAITVFFKGTIVVYLEAIGIEGLNTNEMSSFFLLLLFCAFYLYGSTDNLFQRVIIWLSILTVFFLEVQAASRRGFIVMVFMIAMNIIFAVIPLNNRDSIRKTLVYSFFAIIGAFAFVKLRNYIISSTVLGQRLTGNMIGGDTLREIYFKFAMRQFLQNPVFGVGVGGIEYLQGAYSHSLFYETIACTGIIGSIILIIGLFIPIRTLIKRLFNSYYTNYHRVNVYLNKTILIYLTAIIGSGIAIVMIYDFYFYLSLSLISAGIQFLEENHNRVIDQ